MPGEEATYDVFISYRVKPHKEHVKDLYKLLKEGGLNVYWDQECLEDGVNWERGFCKGLVKSGNFVCLVSTQTFDKGYCNNLKFDSKKDNVILEWQLALELQNYGYIKKVW